MDDKYAIEGTKSTETRLNIDDFSTNPLYDTRWHLFLRALAAVQKALPDDPLGYYRIAGIHGWPLVTWPELKEQPGKTYYCSHGNARFLTWHRPYLLLLEERIVHEAHILATQAPRDQVARYLEEARKIRIPYWDWALKPALPAAATKKTLLIWIPGEGNIVIKNPLYSYVFTGPSRQPAGPETTRFDDDTVAANLKAANLRALVYHALNGNKSYASFGNDRFPDGKDSIEIPHNSVHNSISEVMQDALVTAFDPIFWPFHCVIDYYYSLWQAANPTILYSDNQLNTNTVDYPLAPFNRRGLRPWTSRMIQKTATHDPNSWASGVQYPETTPTSTVADAHAAIQRYAPPANHDGAIIGAIPQEFHRLLPGYPADLPPVASIRREWRVLIKVKNNLVASNFTIYCFLGTPGPSNQWRSDAASIGSFSTFKAPLEICENCRTAEGGFMSGSVYMTDYLYSHLPDDIKLGDLMQRTFLPKLKTWLTKNLDWRILSVDGTEYTFPDGVVTSLYVGVESFFEAYAPPNDEGNPIDYKLGDILGRTFDHRQHVDITAGKIRKGGAERTWGNLTSQSD